MAEVVESPFTCATCGQVAMWSGSLWMEAKVGKDTWWLEAPCIKCGSKLFKIKSDTSKWIGSYGDNG